jgi:1-acyl-sn-glycerol-3-phosphate acyltransferase
MTALRSLLFMVGAVLVTAPFGILVPLSRLFGAQAPFATARAYCRSMLAVARWTCGIRWEVEGWEHVPKTPAIIMAKHQSAWETLFLDGYFPSQCWVIKKELLWLPFVGWGLMAVRAIAIDRSSGANAIGSPSSRKARESRRAPGAAMASAARCSRRAPARRSCPSRTMPANSGAATLSANAPGS